MKLVLTNPAAIALRTLSPDDQRQVNEWFDRLRNWPSDDQVRSHSHRLASLEDTYVLQAPADLRIFFAVEGETIRILDMARRSTILMSGRVPEHGRT